MSDDVKIAKGQAKRLLQLAKNVLYARRINNVKKEQEQYEKLARYISDNSIPTNAGEVIAQAIEHLRRTSIAASMNGIV